MTVVVKTSPSHVLIRSACGVTYLPNLPLRYFSPEALRYLYLRSDSEWQQESCKKLLLIYTSFLAYKALPMALNDSLAICFALLLTHVGLGSPNVESTVPSVFDLQHTYLPVFTHPPINLPLFVTSTSVCALLLELVSHMLLFVSMIYFSKSPGLVV